jgi:hypothetical protein
LGDGEPMSVTYSMYHWDGDAIPASHLEYVAKTVDRCTEHMGVSGSENDPSGLGHGHLLISEDLLR